MTKQRPEKSLALERIQPHTARVLIFVTKFFLIQPKNFECGKGIVHKDSRASSSYICI